DLIAPPDVGLALLERLRLLAPLLLLELVQLRAQLIHRSCLVLVLRAVVLALHDYTGRLVSDPDGRLRLVHVLAAGAARAVDVDAQIARIDLDIDIVLDLGRDEYRRKGRMASMPRVERGLAHEPMN